MNIDNLIKNRSVTSCIASGYHLFTGNIVSLLKALWRPLLMVSLMTTLLIYVIVAMGPIVTVGTAIVWIATLVVFKRHVFSQVAPFPAVGKALRRVLRHFGSYLELAIITALITAVIFAIVLVPTIVMFAAIADNTASINAGDADGLSAGFWVLFFVSLTITAALLFFIQIWQTLAACYLYGSMTARESKQL